MNPLSGLFKPKALAYLFIAAVLLGSLGTLLTFLISDGQKIAAQTVLHSEAVERSIGPAGSTLLLGMSFKYSGSAGCEDFSYLVSGRDGKEIVKVRIRMKDKTVRNKNVRSREIVELVEGAGADFSIVCWPKPDSQASSGRTGEIAPGGVSA